MPKDLLSPTNYSADSLALKTARNLLKEKPKDTYVPKQKLTVGAFGFIYEDGGELIIRFVVNDRRDRRHGVVDTPAAMDPYNKSLIEGMFKKWQMN